jgi:hypothetical protein
VVKDSWEKLMYIDLKEPEAVWLRRTLAKYSESDLAFSIRCKLSDSMKEHEMGGTDHDKSEHPAATGVEAYAEEGRAYYKKAALAQTSIGVSSIIQALAVVAIAFILAGCSLVPQRGDAQRPAADRGVQAGVVGPDKARIDAGEVIKAADDSGCNLGAVLYSEGKRESKIGVYCSGGLPAPGM